MGQPSKIRGSEVSLDLPHPHFIIMEIIPFRIKPHEDPENFSEVYEFLIKGKSKDAYQTEIDIDNLNDLGITDSRCTCPDHTFRQNQCKHIKKCLEILKDFKVAGTIKDASKGENNG